MRRHPIVQGEHAVCGRPQVAITTVLGSCIAVCLVDPIARIGGMNHFLLGEPRRSRPVSRDDAQRYGVHAIEVLINAMMVHGADRSKLRAHLYGGADIVPGLGRIGSENGSFVRRLLQTERIVVTHEDMGGNTPRKVEFMPYEGRSRCIKVASLPERPLAPILGPVVPAEAGELELFQ